MDKNIITRIIRKYLSGRFLPIQKKGFRNGLLKIKILRKKKKPHWNIGMNWKQKPIRTLNLYWTE